MELTKRVEVIAGLALVALIAAGCLLVVAPFVSAILWAAIICFATWPLHQRLDRLCGGRRALAAAIMTVLIVVCTVRARLSSLPAASRAAGPSASMAGAWAAGPSLSAGDCPAASQASRSCRARSRWYSDS